MRGGLTRNGGGAWVETPIPDAPGWYAACLLLRVGDGATLAELRIIPDAGRWQPTRKFQSDRAAVFGRPGRGDWSRVSKDLQSEHAGGVTSRLLRKVPLDAIVDEALHRMNESGRLPKGWDSVARNAPGRPGRAGRDDRFYAVWARRYVDQAARSRSPTRDLAELHGERYGAVVQWIHEARNRGLLSRSAGGTQQGRRGGRLTPKAMKLLRRE